MSKEAMKLALEALENTSPLGFNMESDKKFFAAITALRQAIEQAEQYNATSDHRLMENAQGDLDRVKLVQTGVGIRQAEQAQPFGYFRYDLRLDAWVQNRAGITGTPFYTAPPPRQPEQPKVRTGNCLRVGVCASEGHKIAPPRQPLTQREVEVLDGLIEVQLDHALRCDSIGNRTMAEKQKAWDMERVELLRKLKAAHGIKENT